MKTESEKTGDAFFISLSEVSITDESLTNYMSDSSNWDAISADYDISD